jgi:tRNA pseudouridine55 synthase
LARQRRGRRIDGVLVVDKPPGMTSNGVLQRAKGILFAAKAGHTGSLDPLATGVLPLCFGEATKFAQDLLDADKTYETVVHLGIKTSTGDTEGEVLERRPVDVTLTQIESILEKFRGPISQVPPMHSALKRDGKPLYEYARAGITLEREARSVTIHKLELLAYDAPMLRLRVACSKGTYIRVLGEDVGAALGCGAHLSALRRIEIGALDVSSALTLDQLAEHPDAERNSCLQPVDSLLSSFPALVLDDALANRFRQGQRISLDRAGVAAPCESGRVRVYQAPHCLLGTALLSEGDVLAPERLLAVIASH